jgi:solute:Na+ symporter, SSS family
LRGLVYSLTPQPEETETVWYRQPLILAIIVLVLSLILNIIFF